MLIGGPTEHALTSAPSYEEIEIPENRLMLAVLQEALSTFQRGLHTPVTKELEAFREVDRWFRSRDYDWPFSFESICACLRIDPCFVRAGLNRIRRKAFQNRVAVRTVKAPYRSSRRNGATPMHPPSPAVCSSHREPGRAAARGT